MRLPLGYRYASTYAGIRSEERDDLSLIASDVAASAAALFTTNLVQAAPLKLAKSHLRTSRGKVRAVLINAGNANCATRTGERTALACCRAVAKQLKIPVAQVFPSSTGVIGVELDPQPIVSALPRLVKRLSRERLMEVSRAIMTTDTVPKTAFGEVPLRRGCVNIAGLTKGSGMIHPRMATTLGYILTDAAISPVHLRGMLLRAADRSYHRLTVDGDTSTNDTVLLLANGASGIRPNDKERQVFEEVLCWVMEDLAEMIARDGEGAKKLITIHVTGAANDEAAAQIARGIANSALVKTAIAGSDPNWGRVLSAAASAGVSFDPKKVDISLQGMRVCHGGLSARFDEKELERRLDQKECLIRFTIGSDHKGRARFWTCDMTEEYVRINADYRT